MNDLSNVKMKRARQAGKLALESLYNVQDCLRSARNWGIFDMLGGGFLTGMVKHSRIREASSQMEDAIDQVSFLLEQLQRL